jgi:phage FluMu protein gp41
MFTIRSLGQGGNASVETEIAEPEPKDTFDLEAAAAEAIAACDGDPVAAAKSLIVAYNFLSDEVERLKAMVSTGYSRGALQMRHLP